MGWLENMTLRAKLLLLTTVMLVALGAAAIIGFSAASTGEGGIDEIGQKRLPKVIALAQIRTGQNQVTIQHFRVRGLAGDHERAKKCADALKVIETGLGNVDAGFKIYDPMPRDKEADEIWQGTKKALEEWKKYTEEFNEKVIKPMSAESDPARVAFLIEQSTKLMDEMRPVRTKLIEGLSKIAHVNKEASKRISHEALEEMKSLRQVMIMTIVISSILAILLAALIIRSVTRSITLSVQTINEGAVQISGASDQVASSSTSLAQGASEQASSVEEISATLEQASAAVASNTESARQADMLAKAANQSAKDGMVKGDELVTSMKDVNDSASKIAGIVKAIDQIAFQVNLLALNAAVEAARAGEHGLGFAVVADEVRNLAQRAANSAKETAVVIEEAIGQIKKGTQIANDASSAFKQIDEQSKKVSDLIGEVALSSREQADAVTQLNTAMSQIDQVTQQVAANSEEAAAAAEELNAQAAATLESVAILGKIVGLDTTAGMSGSRAAPKAVTRHAAAQPMRQAAKPSAKIAPKPKPNDDIFPLDEKDLKEF